MGYITIAFAVLHLVVNLSLIFTSTVKRLILSCKRRYVLKRYKVDRAKNQKKLSDNHEERLARWKSKRQEKKQEKIIEDISKNIPLKPKEIISLDESVSESSQSSSDEVD